LFTGVSYVRPQVVLKYLDVVRVSSYPQFDERNYIIYLDVVRVSSYYIEM